MILLYIFIGIAVIQLAYYLGVFGQFAFAKAQKITPKRIPISVIVCAKNEEENVANFIPLLAEQNYPDFEIILIDDVLNSGKTLMHAAAFLLSQDIKKMNTVVLVDRRHRNFPIKADWVGLTLSTTVQEHINVEILKDEISVG